MTRATSCSKSLSVVAPATRRPVVFFDVPAHARQAWESELAAEFAPIWTSTPDVAVAESLRGDAPVLVSFLRPSAALAFIRELRTRKPAAPVLALVDAARGDLASEAVLAGAVDVLTFQAPASRIVAALRREATPDLYAFSASMQQVNASVRRAAAGRASVLLVGERGTGRRAVARAIHAAGPGAGAALPFVVVDCAASDAPQLARELFGATRSDEDGASARGLERISRSSQLYAARGGTLFLQNVPDAPTRVQQRLATLLRDREAWIVEDGGAAALDVQVVTAAEPAIDAAVQEGRVLPDLFRRLSAVRIDVPPLRARREDIAPLANRFMRDVCAELGVPAKLFARSALALLAALPWSGNAADLKALLRAVVGALEGQGLGVDSVLAHVRLDPGAVVIANRGTLREARERFEREYIAASLRLHRGRVTRTAKALGMQRANLYRKMRSLQVAPPR